MRELEDGEEDRELAMMLLMDGYDGINSLFDGGVVPPVMPESAPEVAEQLRANPPEAVPATAPTEHEDLATETNAVVANALVAPAEDVAKMQEAFNLAWTMLWDWTIRSLPWARLWGWPLGRRLLNVV